MPSVPFVLRPYKSHVGNLTKNFNLWETKQIEKTHAKEKQSHAQDNIYVIRQFVYIHGVVGILL